MFFFFCCSFFYQIKNFLFLLWVNLCMITGIYMHDLPPFNSPFFMTPPFTESQKVVTLPLFPPPPLPLVISDKSLRETASLERLSVDIDQNRIVAQVNFPHFWLIDNLSWVMKHAVVSNAFFCQNSRKLILPVWSSKSTSGKVKFSRKFHWLVRQTTTIWQPLKNTNSFHDPFFLLRR